MRVAVIKQFNCSTENMIGWRQPPSVLSCAKEETGRREWGNGEVEKTSELVLVAFSRVVLKLHVNMWHAAGWITLYTGTRVYIRKYTTLTVCICIYPTHTHTQNIPRMEITTRNTRHKAPQHFQLNSCCPAVFFFCFNAACHRYLTPLAHKANEPLNVHLWGRDSPAQWKAKYAPGG